ncbi:MAG: GNAT family N-acetyltransferase [Nitrospiraceae bacterium]|nr:GNAT family N-acetyltransferase [Nitrospiraceae bacterium]
MSQAAITEAASAEDYAAGRMLIEEYAAALAVDLCFQDFSQEMADLPGVYGPPRGCLLLARINGEWVGCVAVRKQDTESCEMKRLYVKTQYRGLGLGRRLAELAIRCAQKLGYSRILLDTLPCMAEAQSLYHSLGFREVDAYYPNPVEGVRYLALTLSHDA